MINFDKVEQSVKALKVQFTAGKLDKNTFEARLLELVDFAADGYYWMFGHETESWYQHDGQRWIQKDPGNLRLLTPQGDGKKQTITSNDEKPEHPNKIPTNATFIEAWRSVEWGWFILSLIILVLIGWIVYISF
jgi:hypothetical protein